MANYIPIMGTPDAAGGYLIKPEYAEPLLDAILRESVVANLVKTERTSSRKRQYPRLIGRPTAGFVAEAADYPVTGGEFATVTINAKKIGTTLMYTEEELEDAYTSPEALLGPEVEKAFAQLIDAHVLGLSAGTAITTSFDNDIHSQIPAGGQVELGASADALALAISAAQGYVEGQGGTPNGIALASDLRQSIRDARDTSGRPLYGPGFGNFTIDPNGQNVWGQPTGFTSNLDAFPAGAGKVAAITGDWSYAHMIIRTDFNFAISTEATVLDGATTHRTWQSDKIAVKYRMRVGFATHNGNLVFGEVRNAT